MSAGADDRLDTLLRRVKLAAAAKSVYPDTNSLIKLQQFALRLIRKIPRSTGYLLQTVSPSVWQAGFGNESVRLLEFAELEWISRRDLTEFGFANGEEKTEYFAFAAGIFGDLICVRCDGDEEGTIVLFDHEEGRCFHLAHDLCEWIERLLLFDGNDLGYMKGLIDKLDPAQQAEVRQFYRGLNPESD